jgi:hypothetical protein
LPAVVAPPRLEVAPDRELPERDEPVREEPDREELDRDELVRDELADREPEAGEPAFFPRADEPDVEAPPDALRAPLFLRPAPAAARDPKPAAAPVERREVLLRSALPPVLSDATPAPALPLREAPVDLRPLERVLPLLPPRPEAPREPDPRARAPSARSAAVSSAMNLLK